MELMEWLTGTQLGKLIFTALVAVLPVIELRGAIPFGVGTLELGHWAAFAAAAIGNMLPVPFLIVYVRRVFRWIRVHAPRLDGVVARLEARANRKGAAMLHVQFWGLLVLVAIPLPGTGAWTGSVVAAMLDMRLRRALPAILFGVVIAGFLITALTYGVGFFLR